MNEEELELWDKIKTYQIGVSDAKLSFSDRLARENGWSLKYSLRAILEYKKFIFLICIQSIPLTPSDQVDQVWHLHLLYTQDYWDEFCEKLLKRKIHHGPTKGGGSEKMKYSNLYTNTLDLYEKVFKEKPPSDIWPSEKERFRNIIFVRVSKKDNFIIPKGIKQLFKW